MDGEAELAIVGAGAAGLATAIFAAERMGPCRIILLDGAKTIGAKILVSGGGRCNVTHEAVTVTDFFGHRRMIKNVLAAFSAQDTVKWFGSLGVELKREETGKLFPVTDQARTVLAALVDRCTCLGVKVYQDHRVTAIERRSAGNGRFVLHHRHGRLNADYVVLATGGRSIPKSGSDGGGYDLARGFGHHVTDTVPALVPLILEDTSFHKALSGLAQEVELTTVVDGTAVDRRTGSLLWTHWGISGPVVMDASRFWTRARAEGHAVELRGNFLPGLNPEQVRSWFKDEALYNPRRSLGRMLHRRLPERFAEALCGHADCVSSTPMGQVSRPDRERLLVALTQFAFRVQRDRGWNNAEVTAGGVPLEEIDFRTMESRLVSGLYLVGEMLDCDGRIGGFNFQWAWATGYLAGCAVAKRRTNLLNPPPDDWNFS